MTDRIKRLESCGNCQFYLDGEHALYGYQNGERGLCRRHPPLPTHITMPDGRGNWKQAYANFPIVRTDDWCGEHAPSPDSALNTKERT